MITRFHIENFKSLSDFDLPPADHRLGPFTCLIGLNGSGKSTLLQALDFVASIISGKVDEWLAQRNWRASEIATNFEKWNAVVSFEVAFKDRNGVESTWQGRFNLTQRRCTAEKVQSGGRILLDLEGDRLAMANLEGELKKREEKLNLVYRGSILSILQLTNAYPVLAFVKNSLRQLKSLELLSPQLLRRRSAMATDIGVGGEKLSAFLAGLSTDKRGAILESLQQFYPHLQNWRVKTLRGGWNDLWFREDYPDGSSVQASHINDGLLRVLAIIAQAHGPYSFLLFDEIENGINPELVEKLVDFLISCGKQVLVTTHSPIILNFIPDEVAKEGVILLYRNRKGETKSARFFDLPAMQEKLRALGPGEVFADTRLSDLTTELEQLGHGSSAKALPL